jgi:ABC-2 type transport system permease protein
MANLSHELRAIYVISFRELRKFIRERSRIMGTMARPILWLLVVGGGMSRLVPSTGGINYIQFIFPGIIGMTILFASIFSAISIVWDREFGFLKEILVAPISRFSVVIGKAMAGTSMSMLQVLMLLVFIPVLGMKITVLQFLLLFFSAGMLAFSLTCFGILVASRMSSYEGFNIIMNFLVMPMFFLSGAMYSVKRMPPVLEVLARLNPFTYGVDVMKNILLVKAAGTSMGPEYPILLDLAVVVGFLAVTAVLANLSFRRAA